MLESAGYYPPSSVSAFIRGFVESSAHIPTSACRAREVNFSEKGELKTEVIETDISRALLVKIYTIRRAGSLGKGGFFCAYFVSSERLFPTTLKVRLRDPIPPLTSITDSNQKL